MTRGSLRLAALAAAAGVLAGGLVLTVAVLAGAAPAPLIWALVLAAGLAAAAAAVAGRLALGPGGSNSAAEGRSPAPSAPASNRISLAALEKEMALAAGSGLSACVLIAGLDVTPGLDVADSMEGLREMTAGGIRRRDLMSDRDQTSILILAPDTPPVQGWVLARRVQERATAAGVGTVRVVLEDAGRGPIAELLEELDVALQTCRSTGAMFGDPARMLAAR